MPYYNEDPKGDPNFDNRPHLRLRVQGFRVLRFRSQGLSPRVQGSVRFRLNFGAIVPIVVVLRRTDLLCEESLAWKTV